MNTGNVVYKCVTFTILLLSAAIGALLYSNWKAAKDENEERKLDESRLIYNIEILKKEKEYKGEYYYRLLHDEDFAERVIRERLGYSAPNEIVFRFKDSTPLGVNSQFGAEQVKLNTQNPQEQDLDSNAESGQSQIAQSEKRDERVISEEEFQPKNKSLFRRLFFSSEENKSASDGDVIKHSADSSANDSAKTEEVSMLFGDKKNSNLTEENSSINLAENSANAIRSEDIKLPQAPRVEMYMPKKVKSQPRTRTSIRFRTDD